MTFDDFLNSLQSESQIRFDALLNNKNVKGRVLIILKGPRVVTRRAVLTDCEKIMKHGKFQPSLVRDFVARVYGYASFEALEHAINGTVVAVGPLRGKVA